MIINPAGSAADADHRHGQKTAGAAGDELQPASVTIVDRPPDHSMVPFSPSEIAWAVLLLLFAVAIYGFWSALGDKPAFGMALPEEA